MPRSYDYSDDYEGEALDLDSQRDDWQSADLLAHGSKLLRNWDKELPDLNLVDPYEEFGTSAPVGTRARDEADRDRKLAPKLAAAMRAAAKRLDRERARELERQQNAIGEAFMRGALTADGQIVEICPVFEEWAVDVSTAISGGRKSLESYTTTLPQKLQEVGVALTAAADGSDRAMTIWETLALRDGDAVRHLFEMVDVLAQRLETGESRKRQSRQIKQLQLDGLQDLAAAIAEDWSDVLVAPAPNLETERDRQIEALRKVIDDARAQLDALDRFE